MMDRLSTLASAWLLAALTLASMSTLSASDINDLPISNPDSSQKTVEPDWTVSAAAQVKKGFVTVYQYGVNGNRIGLAGGILLNDGEHVATCFHSIGLHRRVGIVTPNGKELYPKELVALDIPNDIAILRLPKKITGGLPLAQSDPAVGAPIGAMGNPGGDREYFVTGVVAAPIEHFFDTPKIPLALAIEQGNSGGPVINSNGEVVGMVAAKDLERPGIGYATPTSKLSALLARPDPIPFKEWCKSARIDRKSWRPENKNLWSERVGRLVFQSHAPEEPPHLCQATKQPSGKNGVALHTEVTSAAYACAGIAFDINTDGSHFAWIAAPGAVQLLHLPASATGKRATVIAQYGIAHDFPAHGQQWTKLRIELAEDELRCFANDVLLHTSPAPETRHWGLHVSGGSHAEFKNTAALSLSPPSLLGEDSNRELLTKAHEMDLQAAAIRQHAHQLNETNVRSQLIRTLTGSKKNIPLIAAGLRMAQLNDPGLDLSVYHFQFEMLQSKIARELNDQPANPASVAAAIHKVIHEDGQFTVLHRDDGTNPRILEDPRNLFENREGGVLSMQALELDLARASGLNHAQSTNIPGMILCNPDDPEAKWRFLHTCNGDLLSKTEFLQVPCAGPYPRNDTEIILLDDQTFLRHWMTVQKNQIPASQWPNSVLSYLRTLHEIEPSNTDIHTEMILFQISKREVSVAEGIKLIDPAAFESQDSCRSRMLQVLSFMGLPHPGAVSIQD
ncbi:MAG: serine protease [Verrucomicrobiota bacterium]